MHVLVVALVLAAVVVAVLGCGRSVAEGEPGPPPAPAVTVAEAARLSRAELAARLSRLAASAPPQSLSLGAMCYDVAVSLARVEYVCPVCGEKTLYADWQGNELTDARRLLTRIRGVDVRLDESQFCRTCCPEVEKPELGLLVYHEGADLPHRVSPVSPLDIELIALFLEGKDRYRNRQERETALQKFVPRLRELLGVAAPGAAE
jgi:hypothetical protein